MTQAGADAGHVLQGVAETARLVSGVEQVVDLCAQLVEARYSDGQRCGSSSSVGSSGRNLIPSSLYTKDRRPLRGGDPWRQQ
jgi:hypothetical protein